MPWATDLSPLRGFFPEAKPKSKIRLADLPRRDK
jgi:hypothetical protein